MVFGGTEWDFFLVPYGGLGILPHIYKVALVVEDI